MLLSRTRSSAFSFAMGRLPNMLTCIAILGVQIAQRFLSTVYATYLETGRMYEKFNVEEVCANLNQSIHWLLMFLMLLLMNACLKSSTWSRCACTKREQIMALGQADRFWFWRMAASSGGGYGSSNSARFVTCFQVALLPAKFHS